MDSISLERSTGQSLQSYRNIAICLIKVLLKSALTDQIDSREVYMKGIDVSYYYEGYNTYKAVDL